MPQPAQPKTVFIYADETGNEPYVKWLGSLRDEKTKERIRVRIRRLESGSYGDVKPVGSGVSELRLTFGAGYRIYFGEEEGNIIILLLGGDKSSQKQDIKTAKKYWEDYKQNG